MRLDEEKKRKLDKEQLDLQNEVTRVKPEEKVMGAIWQVMSERAQWQYGQGWKDPTEEQKAKTSGALAKEQKSVNFSVDWVK